MKRVIYKNANGDEVRVHIPENYAVPPHFIAIGPDKELNALADEVEEIGFSMFRAFSKRYGREEATRKTAEAVIRLFVEFGFEAVTE